MTPLILTLFACSSAPERPEGIPDDALYVTVADGQVVVDGVAVAAFSALETDPTDQLFQPLQEPLAGEGALWVELPGDTPWFKARRIIGTARGQGRADLWVSVAGSDEALHPEPPPRFGLAGTCPDGPFEVFGVEPLITLAPQRGIEGSWVLGTARFLPVIELGSKRQPVDGLPPTCLKPPDCTTLFPEGVLRATCQAAAEDPGAARLRLGGQYGCLLPIAKAPEEISTWRSELSEVGPALGLHERDLLMVMPEARTRWDGVLALMGGLVDGKRRAPAVGTPLVEGNDGPPVCNATVRTAAQLDAAAAQWVGGLVASGAPAPEAPPEDPPGG